MLKALRYDLYKIFKSKTLLGVFVASVFLSVLDAFLVELHDGDTCLFQHLSTPMLVPLLPLVCVVPFVCKDFSSRFSYNVFPEYSVKDKIYYVLSKVVYIFAVNLIWYAVFFLSHYAFVSLRCYVRHVPFTLEWISFDGTMVITSAQEGKIIYLGVIVNAFALEMILLFLSLLTKREYFVLIVFLLYYFLSPSMYDAVNKVMGLDSWDGFRQIQWFTVFGLQYKLRDLPFGEKALRIPGYARSIYISLGYSALFALLSGLVVVTKKNV